MSSKGCRESKQLVNETKGKKAKRSSTDEFKQAMVGKQC